MLGVLLLLVLALQSQARAEDSGTFAGYGRSSMEKRSTLLPFRVDVHGVMTWESDLGAGLRLDIPLFDRERVYNARDELAISVGADISFLTFGGSNRLIAWPTVTAMWTLAVSERFSFYPEFGIVACIQRQDWKGLYPNVGFGGRFQLYKSLSLMGRLGWPMAVSIGLTF
jgi:hypothetical protein